MANTHSTKNFQQQKVGTHIHKTCKTDFGTADWSITNFQGLGD